jgi:secreted trypsin-like serine protease
MRFGFIFIFLHAFFLLLACHSTNDAQFLNNKNTISIIGGQPVSANQYPFVVNLWLNSPADVFVGHLCGASLIHSHWVLTAAHCVLQDVTDKTMGTIKLSEMTLFLGSLQASGHGGRNLKAKQILIHPQFSWPSFDVALIELVENVMDVPPIRLDPIGNPQGNHANTATVVGWGLIDEQGQIESKVLREVNLPLVSLETCAQDPYVQKRKWQIGAETICTRTQMGKSASCHGDSGGPLFQNRNGTFVQIGIVSWGSACNLADQGHQADVEGYSSVAAVLPWIQGQIEN